MRALSYYHVAAFRSISYVGDGVWDVRAAQSLGYKFVGIGSHRVAEGLHVEGADIVIPDFDTPGAVDQLFEIALGAA